MTSEAGHDEADGLGIALALGSVLGVLLNSMAGVELKRFVEWVWWGL